MFRFQVHYFVFSLLVVGIEVFIAACMHDSVIRPYGGDFLVVILLYCLVRGFWDFPVVHVALGVLLFSYLLEAGQYFGLADRLGFKGPSVMRILLGSYFTWTDILAYTLGILSVLGVERMYREKREIEIRGSSRG